jgi:hypothetical protein
MSRCTSGGSAGSRCCSLLRWWWACSPVQAADGSHDVAREDTQNAHNEKLCMGSQAKQAEGAPSGSLLLDVYVCWRVSVLCDRLAAPEPLSSCGILGRTAASPCSSTPGAAAWVATPHLWNIMQNSNVRSGTDQRARVALESRY